MQLLQLQPHLHPQAGIKIRQRLIEQKHRRFTYDGATHRHALALTAREFARPTHQQVIQFQAARCVQHPLANLLFAHAADFQAIGHVLLHRHVGIKRVILEHHRNAAIFWLFLSDAPVVDVDITGADALQSGYHAQQRRFTAAGWPHHHHKLAVIDGDVQRLNDLIFAIVGLGYCLKGYACHLISHSQPDRAQRHAA